MDMEEAVVAGSTAAQGDLAEVVARAGAMAMAAAASHHHRRPPSPSPSPSPSPAAADHSHIVSPSSAARAAGQQIMVVPAACYYDEEPRPAAAAAACGDAVMFDAPSSAMAVVDPYHLSSSSSSAAMAPAPPYSGYWLPPQQISQHACYGLDVPMGGAAADADGDEPMPMMMRISPVTIPPPSHHHQIMKSRKNEVKKVVCIPALPPASSRPGGGEVIPSDLWAWRKYGQKPIKGSPYPRGYYRCSSSKGCMARKQVERSRSDPNMLVITYTAEHNHPWPMQRNVLAGYSRPHTTHISNCKKKNSCRVEPTSSSWPTSSSSSSSSKNANYSEHNAVVPSSNTEYRQMTNMTEDNNAAGYVAYAIDEECVTMHQPINCNSMVQPSDEVFAELEELEPSNPVNANIYSRGVSYEWQKF